MRGFWKHLRTREDEFLRSAKPEYRHGVPFVSVSALAGQFYCEYKVENEFALGRIETEAKDEGIQLHDELLPGVEITAEEFARLVETKEPSYAVLKVWGTVGGLRMVGMPDHIVWKAGRPLWLLELKTTKGETASLWEDQLSQVIIYGLLLDLMGFDCSKLRLALVRLRAHELSDESRRMWIMKVSKALIKNNVKELESTHGAGMRVHVIPHDRQAATRAVLAKRGYWIGEREPSSSTSVGKCRACEYNRVCAKTLYRPV